MLAKYLRWKYIYSKGKTKWIIIKKWLIACNIVNIIRKQQINNANKWKLDKHFEKLWRWGNLKWRNIDINK